MRGNTLKVILICCCVLSSLFFFFFFLFIIRPTVEVSSNSHSSNPYSSASGSGCTKIPASLANALVHYATSNITPQQTTEEILVSLRILHHRSPCNFLVFGLGLDSLMWASLNHGGRTVFLEEDQVWMERMRKQGPTSSLESYHVVYGTKMTEAEKLHDVGTQQQRCKVVSDPRASKCELALKGLPTTVYETGWDVIMVDAPTGYHAGAPGRMGAIYTAGLMARTRRMNKSTSNAVDVLVHDVDRRVEDEFSKSFLCEGYMVEQQGRIRHFNIPRNPIMFCPPLPLP